MNAWQQKEAWRNKNKVDADKLMKYIGKQNKYSTNDCHINCVGLVMQFDHYQKPSLKESCH
jgi:hypothetical protein